MAPNQEMRDLAIHVNITALEEEIDHCNVCDYENCASHFRLKHLSSSVALLPGLGSLSPSKARAVGAETSGLTPGLRLSRANGQSNPSVDSISIIGAGGKVFSSALRGWKDGTQTEADKRHSDREIL